MNKVIQGDSLEVMKTLSENSVDSIVTDPPYELGFMGKSWDSTGIANNKEMWVEALRVLKPGGHLLSFGGTRTYHRMACAIEDAGFEVRDMIAWVYGSGFPKSLNIGKAVDKLQGNEREVVGKKEGTYADIRSGSLDASISGERERLEVMETKGTSEYEGWGTALKPALEPITVARKPLSEKTVAENVLKWGTGGINIDGSRVAGKLEGDPNRFAKTDGGDFVAKLDIAPVVRTEGRFPANLIHDGSDEVVGLFPNTKTGSVKPYKRLTNDQYSGSFPDNTSEHTGDSGSASRFFKTCQFSQEELDEIQEDATDMEEKLEMLGISQKEEKTDISLPIYQSAHRFAYIPKASKSERNKGCEGLDEKEKPLMGEFKNNPGRDTPKSSPTARANYHPTVKPQALMKYLITLITPKGGTVLDPFAGSGSTLVAANDLGFNYIGIELTPEYIPIIEARLSAEKNTLF